MGVIWVVENEREIGSKCVHVHVCFQRTCVAGLTRSSVAWAWVVAKDSKVGRNWPLFSFLCMHMYMCD